MLIRFFLFAALGFVAGVATVLALGTLPPRPAIDAKAPAIRQPVLNEEFEAIERRLVDSRDREWNLTQDMKPCFRGSRLCFLLSGAAGEHSR